MKFPGAQMKIQISRSDFFLEREKIDEYILGQHLNCAEIQIIPAVIEKLIFLNWGGKSPKYS